MIILKIIGVLYAAAVLFNFTYIYITICRLNQGLIILNPFTFLFANLKLFLPYMTFKQLYLACANWDWLYKEFTKITQIS